MKRIFTLIPVVLGLAVAPFTANAQTTAKDKAKAAEKAADTKVQVTKKPKAAKKDAAAKPRSKALLAGHKSIPSKQLVEVATKQIGGLSPAQKGALTKLLNGGSKDELVKVPGVGAKLADNIIKSRPFAQPTDLVNVNGIGVAKLKNVVAYIKDPEAATAKAKKKAATGKKKPAASTKAAPKKD